MTPDRDLISRIGQGDQEAFAELYRCYRARLFQYAQSLLRSREMAEDAVHDAFIGLVGQVARGGVPGLVSPYLYAAVRNRCFDLLRRRVEVSVDDVDPELLAAPAGDLERIERRQLVNRMLLALPDEQREVVVLRIFHGLEFREIALLQGTPVSTALSRYQYGLNRLRKEFTEHGAQ